MRFGNFLRAAAALAFGISSAVMSPISAVAETTGNARGARQAVQQHSSIVVSGTQIKLFKIALALRPEQERYWGPVEAALLDLGKPMPAAKIQRASLRTAAKADQDTRFKRLSAAAIPLIKTFDDKQRDSLQTLSRMFGFERWLAAH